MFFLGYTIQICNKQKPVLSDTKFYFFWKVKNANEIIEPKSKQAPPLMFSTTIKRRERCENELITCNKGWILRNNEPEANRFYLKTDFTVPSR